MDANLFSPLEIFGEGLVKMKGCLNPRPNMDSKLTQEGGVICGISGQTNETFPKVCQPSLYFFELFLLSSIFIHLDVAMPIIQLSFLSLL